jgi:hypothetical protein
MSRLLMLAALATLLAPPAIAFPIAPTSQQSSTSASASISGAASASEIDPQDSQARLITDGMLAQAAGRSRPGMPPVLAANGSFASPAYTERDAHAEGVARHELRFDAPAGRLILHLELPELLLEFTDNGERIIGNGVAFGGDLTAVLSVGVCLFGPGIPANACPLSLDASLVGHFQDERLTVSATSTDAAVDLSLLNNQALAIVDDGFQRTATWNVAGFTADIDVSAFGGRSFSLVYDIFASADGRAFGTGAAAAFNDPFLLETDPTGANPISLEFQPLDVAAIPSPGGLGTFALALCGLAVLRRRVP